mgnify:CR=1 FL=1
MPIRILTAIVLAVIRKTMKRLTFIVLVALIAGVAFGQTERESRTTYTAAVSGRLEGGVHTSVVWKDIFNAKRNTNRADSISSSWIWIGYDQNVTVSDSQGTNGFLFDTAPAIYNLLIRAYQDNDADTIRADRIRFEVARDTTRVPLANVDSSSTVISNGNANRGDWKTWTEEELITVADSAGWIIPLRVFGGAYLRTWIIVTSSLDTVRWECDLEVPAGGR